MMNASNTEALLATLVLPDIDPRRAAATAPTQPPAPLSSRLDAAFALARELHASQTRKSTAIPYLTHLMAVAALVGEHGGSEDEMIAALLHDAVEDCGGAPVLARIREAFGDAVAAIVDACTDDASGGEKAPWGPRKLAYIRHLATAPLPVLRVSCADKLHNARAIVADLKASGPSAFTRFTGDRNGTLWYYLALADLFGARLEDGLEDPGLKRMAWELYQTVQAMEASAEEPERKVVLAKPWTPEENAARDAQILEILRRPHHED